MTEETPLQAAIREKAAELHYQEEAALKRCRSAFELAQCRIAYADLLWAWYDIIGQRFGLPPMLVCEKKSTTDRALYAVYGVIR